MLTLNEFIQLWLYVKVALDDVQIHNSSVLKNLVKGDLIEIPKLCYSHWAIYVGDGMVIHLTVDGNDSTSANLKCVFAVCCINKNKAIVKLDDFWVATCGYKAFKNNNEDKCWRHFSAKKTVRRAKIKIGKKGYNVMRNNCEHFVNFCRYGESQSGQAHIAGRLFIGVCIFIRNPHMLLASFMLCVVRAVGRADIINLWHQPYSAKKTVRRAKSKIWKKGYNALRSNCKHFVNYCIGKSKSFQAAFVKCIFVFGVILPCILLFYKEYPYMLLWDFLLLVVLAAVYREELDKCIIPPGSIRTKTSAAFAEDVLAASLKLFAHIFKGSWGGRLVYCAFTIVEVINLKIFYSQLELFILNSSL